MVGGLVDDLIHQKSSIAPKHSDIFIYIRGGRGGGEKEEEGRRREESESVGGVGGFGGNFLSSWRGCFSMNYTFFDCFYLFQ